MAHRPQFIVIIIVIVSSVAITTIRTMGIITIVIAIEAIVIRMRIKIAVIIITLLVVLIVTPIISSPECGFRMWRMSRLVSPVFGAPTYKGFFCFMSSYYSYYHRRCYSVEFEFQLFIRVRTKVE